ncbi:MAG: choice-of-anchor V domain-containing protein [Bacteroidota bacterium]
MKKYIRTTLAIIACAVLVVVNLSNASGPGGDRTNAPGSSGNCSACHGGTANLGGDIAITVIDKSTASAATQYTPGKTYTIGIKMGGTSIKKGFQATVINSSNAGIGTMSGNSTGTSIYTSGNRSICGHNTPGLGVWYVDWTAPAAASGTVTIYASGVVSNANGSDNGDQVVKTSLSFPATASSNINSLANSTSFSVYPNPASHEIKFSSNVSKVTIMSQNGKVVFSGKNVDHVNIENLSNGLYFVNAIAENQAAICKQFIKQ